MLSHEQTVQRQFDPQAAAYLSSSAHSAGPDLEWTRQWLRQRVDCGGAALDAGCGAGHLAFVLAESFPRVCAADPAPTMVQTVVQEAHARGLHGIEGCVAPASALRFDDASFALVVTRFSAHHWYDLGASLRELRRVLQPGGQLLLIDVLGDDVPLVDAHLQAIELLRDPGHVRDLVSGEWQERLRMAGLRVGEFRSWPLRLEFAAWVRRMRVPEARVELLRSLLREAPAEVQHRLAIEADGSFTVRVGLFLAE